MVDSKKLFESVNRLRSAEFQPFIGWLVRERDDVLERMSVAPIDHVGRLQGDAQRLKQIMDLIECAPASLDRLAGATPLQRSTPTTR